MVSGPTGQVYNGVLDSILVQVWFKLIVPTTLKTGLAKTDSGGDFGGFDSAESTYEVAIQCGQGNQARMDSAQPTHK